MAELAQKAGQWVDSFNGWVDDTKDAVMDIMMENETQMAFLMGLTEATRVKRIENLLKRKRDEEAEDPNRAAKKSKENIHAVWDATAFIAKSRHEAIMKLTHTASDYSNPARLIRLPFPSIHLLEPNDRFAVDANSEFEYMGREKFLEVYEKIIHMDPHESTLDIFGTSGYGKSFILAALATHLHQYYASPERHPVAHVKRTRVVYLPSCGSFLKHGPDYLRRALMLAYADDDGVLKELTDMSPQLQFGNAGALASALQPLNLFLAAQQSSTHFIFIVDQFNELIVPTDSPDSGRCLELANFLVIGFVVKGASPNYTNAKFVHHLSHQSPAVFAYGGLTPKEWAHWKQHWATQQPEDLSDEEVEHMEFQTGLLPFHLRQLEAITTKHKNMHFTDVASKKTEIEAQLESIEQSDDSKEEKEANSLPLTEELKELDEKLKSFEPLSYEQLWSTFCEIRYVINIRAHIEDQRYLGQAKYIEFLRHCVLGMIYAASAELYDHRYFYHDEHGRMRCINGMVKDIATTIISQASTTQLLQEKSQLIHSIRTEQNPSSKGFLVERACIGGIFLNGLTLTIGGVSHIFKPSKLIYFSSGAIDAVLNDDTFCVLYVPTVFNYKGVDAILRILPKQFVPKSSGKAGQKEIEAMQTLFNPAAANANTHSEFILVGIQITISSQGAASHRYSIPSFFSDEASWIPSTLRATPLPNPLVMGRHFCWILPKKVLAGGRQSKNVPAGPKSLRQRKKEKDNAKPAKSIQVQSFEESFETCEAVVGAESVLS